MLRLAVPTHLHDSPQLNPIEMLWCHFLREETHHEFFPTVKARLPAAREALIAHIETRALSPMGSADMFRKFSDYM